jgi:hypothetical protein
MLQLQLRAVVPRHEPHTRWLPGIAERGVSTAISCPGMADSVEPEQS